MNGCPEGINIPKFIKNNERGEYSEDAKKLKETVQYAPLSQLVLETDCPYMSPEPNRGKRNSSLNLPYVAQAIAELKGITAEEVIDVTRQNAEKLLGIHQ